jgi:Xaa-Pro aminopeptidase
LTTEELYLVDSGGQYKDGTTDVTRTMHFGTPKPFEKECFTRVLKGQIRLAMAIFPNKLMGNCLDTLARMALWEVGLDYGHGTDLLFSLLIISGFIGLNSVSIFIDIAKNLAVQGKGAWFLKCFLNETMLAFNI